MGTDGEKHIDFDYNISSEFLPFAKRVLQKIYPENEIASYEMMGSNQRSNKLDMETLEVRHLVRIVRNVTAFTCCNHSLIN